KEKHRGRVRRENGRLGFVREEILHRAVSREIEKLRIEAVEKPRQRSDDKNKPVLAGEGAPPRNLVIPRRTHAVESLEVRVERPITMPEHARNLRRFIWPQKAQKTQNRFAAFLRF